MSLLNVDKIDPQSGTALEVGTSGDTVTVPSGVGLTLTDSTLLLPTTITSTTEVKTNKISPATGTAFALGDSGDTFTVPSGATIVNSGTATGFGGGKVLQVVQVVLTDTFTTTSTSFTDITGMAVAITPSATSSKVLVLVDMRYCMVGSQAYLNLLRGTTEIYKGVAASNRPGVNQSLHTADPNVGLTTTIIFLDSPSSTSATTYKLQTLTMNGSYAVAVNRGQNDDDQTDRGRFASSITAIEIGA